MCGLVAASAVCGICGQAGHNRLTCPRANEQQQQQQQYHCAVCGEVGHNERTCTAHAAEPMAGRQQRCSICQQPGHNAATHDRHVAAAAAAAEGAASEDEHVGGGGQRESTQDIVRELEAARAGAAGQHVEGERQQPIRVMRRPCIPHQTCLHPLCYPIAICIFQSMLGLMFANGHLPLTTLCLSLLLDGFRTLGAGFLFPLLPMHLGRATFILICPLLFPMLLRWCKHWQLHFSSTSHQLHGARHG